MMPSKILRFSNQFNVRLAKCATTRFARFQSTSRKSLLLVDVNDKTGIATMTMNRPPVNSLNLELLSAMSTSLDELTKNNSRGMILASVSIITSHISYKFQIFSFFSHRRQFSLPALILMKCTNLTLKKFVNFGETYKTFGSSSMEVLSQQQRPFMDILQLADASSP